MVGAYPFKTRMLPRLKALGYREVSDREENICCRRRKRSGATNFTIRSSAALFPARIQTAYSMEEPEQYKTTRGLSL